MNKLEDELAELEAQYVKAVEGLDISAMNDEEMDKVGELVNDIRVDIRVLRMEIDKGWNGPYSYDADEAIQRTEREIETLAETIQKINEQKK